MNSKYSNFLTILLVVVIIAIVAIIGFLGYKYYETYIIKNESEDFVDNYLNDSSKDNQNDNENLTTDDSIFSGVDEGTITDNSSSTSGKKYNGFTTAGTIEIPAINLKSPIIAVSEYSKSALETAICEYYGVGLNQVGNTTLAGHNYRNGTFFSNNKKLNIGDKIYITDLTGKRLAYTIYDKYEADENYSDYLTRDTNGAIEISLTTCTDDSKARLLIFARADV